MSELGSAKNKELKAKHNKQSTIDPKTKDVKNNLTILDKNLTYVQHMLPKRGSRQETQKFESVCNRSEILAAKPKSMIENTGNYFYTDCDLSSTLRISLNYPI